MGPCRLVDAGDGGLSPTDTPSLKPEPAGTSRVINAAITSFRTQAWEEAVGIGSS